MKNRLIINIVLVLILSLSLINAAEFFDTFKVTFEDEKPDNLQILSFKCLNSGCTQAEPLNLEYYKGKGVTCWTTYALNNQIPQFYQCMESMKYSSNIVNLHDSDTIGNDGNVYFLAKYDNINDYPFGMIHYLYTSGDTYIPVRDRITTLSCNAQICMNSQPADVYFGRVANAHAEIQQVNIKNIDNPLLPIQIEVPVKIEQTVCSAFRFSNPNIFIPTPPQGYSDYSANTKIRLRVTNEETGQQYLDQTITIPIEADTCAGLTAFSWTPPSSVENVPIKFRIDTDVIDEQVSSSISDWMEVIEVVYPANLDGTCWSRAYDFTLSNVPTFNLNTGIAQIKVGETLYAGFRGGAYRDESITPMPFIATFYFDGVQVHQSHLESTSNLQEYFVDLTSRITGLSEGSYEVKLVTTPQNINCDMRESVEQIQNLQLLAPERFRVDFLVRDTNAQAVSQANINLKLIEADGNFQVEPVYSQTKSTNSQGRTYFDNVYRGTYVYEVEKTGYELLSREIYIGSNTNIQVLLNEKNFPPVIVLPDSFISYYQEDIKFDLKEYVFDSNDLFEDLNIEYNLLAGNSNVNFDGRYFIISANAPSVSTLEIIVRDPHGAEALDTVDLIFIDNEAPVITRFEADPDSGAAPFLTHFRINVIDAEDDFLMCSLTFGDGNSIENECNSLNGISHTYTSPGTYNVRLTAWDEYNTPVQETIQVFVFQREYGSPKINYFNLSSSNGNNVPTNLVLNWDVEHTQGEAMTCVLRINEINHPVDCDLGVYNIPFFGVVGTSTFTLIATDNENNQDLRSITRTFGEEEWGIIEINKFKISSSNGNYVPTNLTFTIDASQSEGRDITCVLKVDKQNIPVDCVGEQTINNFNILGTSSFILKVNDDRNELTRTISKTFLEKDFGEIKINQFDLFSSNGNYVPTNLTFTINAIQTEGKDLSCVLRVNGVDTAVDCVGDYTIPNFNEVGVSTFTLIVNDGKNELTRTISRTFLEKDFGEIKINQFDLFSSNGNYVPTNIILNWNAIQTANKNLICTLNYGMTILNVPCKNGEHIIKNFNIEGKTNFILIVRDSNNLEVSSIIKKNFIPEVRGEPIINWFYFETDTGDFTIPNNITFNYDISHTQNRLMACYIYINGEKNKISCDSNTYRINDFNIQGISQFILSAREGDIVVNSTINQLFVPKETEINDYDLTLDMVDLIIDDILSPGEFEFGVVVLNETLASRELFFTPRISCLGVTATLRDDIRLSAISKKERDEGFIYQFKLDTKDFKTRIPVDTNCRFILNTKDLYGTDIDITKSVRFEYPKTELELQSIRGKGIDIMNYMNSVISTEINRGYNVNQFNIVNNEAKSKTISITLISPELNLIKSVTKNLVPGETRSVKIPIFIPEDIDSGLYPIRVNVFDGTDRQVRYSYLNIN